MKKRWWPVLIMFMLWILNPQLSKAQIEQYGTALCGDTINFYCHTVSLTTITEQIETDEGIKLIDKQVLETWELLWGNKVEREIVMKINRKNTKLNRGNIIAVPYDMIGKTFMDYSPYPKNIETSEKTIIWNPALLAYVAYNQNGSLVRWGPGVGGKNYCPDTGRSCRTRPGEFRISRIEGQYFRSGRYPKGCSGTNCASMSFAMFFEENYAFHSGNVPGYHDSHGCVRLFYSDAQWLNKNFIEIGTKVIIRPYP